MILDVQDIHTFYGKSHVIKGISLTINEGEVVCLLGRNGAGKTTTLRSIVGIVPPKEGRIFFKGKEITGKPPFARIRLGIGYVPEDMRIFPDLTVKENLEVSVIQRGKDSDRWTIENVFSLFPKLKILEASNGTSLSGGEQQMLAIARALVSNPSLLVLDEPTEGLAPIIVQELSRLLKKIKNETTILLSEQNARFAMEFSDRAYIIDRGKMVYQGSIGELCDQEEVRNRYLGVYTKTDNACVPR
jgi:branched-chain amino acid transport system ATP-binding protein